MSHPVSTASDAWTTRRLLDWMTGYLKNQDVDSPRVVAEMLIAFVLGCPRMKLYMEVDRPAAAGELDRLRSLVARAARHEPVQYIVGEAQFYWRSFTVEPTTLIPQPSTETLVDFILGSRKRRPEDLPDFETDWSETDPEAQAGPDPEVADPEVTDPEVTEPTEPTGPVEPAGEDEGPPVLLADIGTGCGCIAVSLAAQIPGSRVLATDIVPAALELAAANAARYKVDGRIEFVAGDGTAPLAEHVARTGVRFDAICSNPPYIPAHENTLMDTSVREHVPASAWDGGADGLDVIRPIVATARDLLVPGGWLAVEIADSQRDAAIALAQQAGFVDVQVLKDGDGLWRVLIAQA